jgi:hypothetical protein
LSRASSIHRLSERFHAIDSAAAVEHGKLRRKQG